MKLFSFEKFSFFEQAWAFSQGWLGEMHSQI